MVLIKIIIKRIISSLSSINVLLSFIFIMDVSVCCSVSVREFVERHPCKIIQAQFVFTLVFETFTEKFCLYDTFRKIYLST